MAQARSAQAINQREKTTSVAYSTDLVPSYNQHEQLNITVQHLQNITNTERNYDCLVHYLMQTSDRES